MLKTFLLACALGLPAAAIAGPTPTDSASGAAVDPVQPLLKLDNQLNERLNGDQTPEPATKARRKMLKHAKDLALEEFREDLPLTNGKTEAMLDQLPLAPAAD